MNEPPITSVPSGPFPHVVPVLHSGPVRLRAMTEADLPALIESGSDPDAVRWTTVPHPYGTQDARDYLDLHAQGWSEPRGIKHWAVEVLVADRDGTDRDADRGAGIPFAGIIDLRPGAKEGDAWETGFSLHPAARGRGVMSAALRSAAAWAFEHGAPSLYWYAGRGNFASWRVAHACGFTHHGTLPSRVAYRALGTTDAWVASLLPGQPMTPRHPWVTPPVLESGGVRLRPLREDDTLIAEPHDHPPHHLPARAVPTPETFDDWLLRRGEAMALGRSINWCIADAATDEAVGEVLVFVHDGALVDGGTAELGYAIRPSARGGGLTRRAAELAADYALTPAAAGGLGLRRLVAETAADNIGSNRILERCGFARWGREEASDAPDGSVCAADHWERFATS